MAFSLCIAAKLRLFETKDATGGLVHLHRGHRKDPTSAYRGLVYEAKTLWDEIGRPDMFEDVQTKRKENS